MSARGSLTRPTHKFELAEHGFFRQAVIQNPKDAHAMFNWALVLQYMHNDYDGAEQFYMRALDAEPSDRRIVENYNYLLTTYKMTDYDAYEAYRRLQEERAMVAVKEQSDAMVAAEQTDAAIQVQKTWRGYRVRDCLWVSAALSHRKVYCCVRACVCAHCSSACWPLRVFCAVADAVRAHCDEAP